MWILPFAFYPWAASEAPASIIAPTDLEDECMTPSRPWVIFGGLALLPLIDYGLRRASPSEIIQGVKQLTCVLGEAEQHSCLELLRAAPGHGGEHCPHLSV